MTVKEIVLAYLKANGYDGLLGGYDCGCYIDDLMPCGGDSCGVDDCSAAYKIPVHCDTCEADCDSRDEEGVTHCLTMEKPDENKTQTKSE